MTSYAESARTSARASAERRQRPRREAASSRRPVAGGIAWIALLAVLLAGVVAVNVVVLRLNLSLDRAGTERVELQADVARLQSELSSAASSLRIQQQAEARLGLVPADSSATTYIQLGSR